MMIIMAGIRIRNMFLMVIDGDHDDDDDNNDDDVDDDDDDDDDDDEQEKDCYLGCVQAGAA